MSNCTFDNGYNCLALNEMKCTGCGFRKTQEELEAGRAKAAKRILKLEPELRSQIMVKYYGGGSTFSSTFK